MSTNPPAPNAFIGKTKPPTQPELDAALGPANKLWDRLVTELIADLGVFPEWGSSSKKLGWSLRLKLEKRIIVYLAPSTGCFLASFALGDKAMKAARQSGLPGPVLKMLDEARRYAEGTAVRLNVKTANDADTVKKLAGIKLEN